MANDWNNGLFGCFNDCGTCLITYIAPCYTFGKNAEAVGDSCLLCGLAFFVPVVDLIVMSSVRGKIREQHGISGSFIGDCAATICCPFCSLVQSAQQVKGAPGSQSIARC
ncbi:predicted protein [Nematostella vectensis]|uniref:Uncharacterized protein n=1 Tax=Nematostella vectensis TaxID=45351 RepID=A7RFB0_NEMVE|nr:protein PLANT CADMIUM RESISTANCE 2 [Nematostella vectensis]EDO50068.1 predicted protein [Nematostella vectensis]|eukprot:XP_001642131.1 predicted protein [Nematostella vectensis]